MCRNWRRILERGLKYANSVFRPLFASMLVISLTRRIYVYIELEFEVQGWARYGAKVEIFASHEPCVALGKAAAIDEGSITLDLCPIGPYKFARQQLFASSPPLAC